ncbi:MAG: tRNA pseudouridine synthase A [Chlamydiae bacterium]|nr:tRNA pseudouridine synthase A [Chlamydiota bacterium]
MPKYKLTISYDGTQYGGWQVQPNAPSIQALCEEALTTALRNEIKIVGAGRTDAGVHAKAQIAHFYTEVAVEKKKLQPSLNGLLPLDIRVLTLEDVHADFHARYSATGKVYRYHITLNRVQLPFRRLYALHVSYPIDMELLKKACTLFIGTHDFTSFSNESHKGSAANNPVRILRRLEVVEAEDELYLEFEGNGFLYKMVRNITGMLLDIARGKLSIEALPKIFEAKDRRKAGSAAPPHGLILHSIDY